MIHKHTERINFCALVLIFVKLGVVARPGTLKSLTIRRKCTRLFVHLYISVWPGVCVSVRPCVLELPFVVVIAVCDCINLYDIAQKCAY